MKTGNWICQKCGKKGAFSYFPWEGITKTIDDAYDLHLNVSPSCDAEGEEFQVEFAADAEDEGNSS